MQINQIKRKQRLILLSFVASIILTAIKFYAYYVTSSNAILSDALESIINVIASGFAFYSIYLSSLPKDRNHPYGHGKIEFFSAGFEGALIVIASVFIFIEGMKRLIDPSPIENLEEGALYIFITIVINFFIGVRLVKLGRETNSLALTADGKHLLSDSISSLILIASVVLILLTGYLWIDSVASIFFGLFLAYSGFKLIRKSVEGLMDAADEELVKKVVDHLNDNRKCEWIDVHNLRVQQYGSDLHVDCHLTLPYYLTLSKVHDEVHEFEETLKAIHVGQTEIFVHADPCIPEFCKFCTIMECPVRQEEFQDNINWTVNNLVKNQKLYLQD